ncbi:MAG TPA: kelch repeat-containing protein [Candidatus Bathyarchaeia archaeon]|nr:kelch repeat-containing protein [Candidatus Bathyarchaeia archaeon]
MLRKNQYSRFLFVAVFMGLIGLNLSPFFVASTMDAPSARFGHVMVYDPQNSQIILFGGGGDNSQGALETTWLYSSQSQSWTALSNISSPEARSNHRMVYNSISKKVILFGGKSLSTSYFINDTWEFDPATNEWSELHPAVSPSVRAAHGMYFDPVFNEIVLFGGAGPVTHDSETWIYNCTANIWYQINPATHPEKRYGHSFVYDEELQVGVFFGGRYVDLMSDTWFFNRSSLTWAKQETSPKPIRRYHTGLVYNPSETTFIMFGGDNEETPGRSLDDTWIFNSSSSDWLEIEPSLSPPPRDRYALVFDLYLNRALLFGGYGSYSTLIGDFWLYDANTMTWSQGYTIESSTVTNSLWILLFSLGSIVGVTHLIKILLRQNLQKTK